MDQEQWNEYKKRTRTYWVGIDFGLLHSEAYKKINYAPALKMLNWFHEKKKIRKDKSKRSRWKVVDGLDFAFTYDEAGYRGLSRHQTAKALKELYRFGFIDIKDSGTGLPGGWTKYTFSTRWRCYGTTDFKELPYPRCTVWANYGYRNKNTIWKRAKKRVKKLGK